MILILFQVKTILKINNNHIFNHPLGRVHSFHSQKWTREPSHEMLDAHSNHAKEGRITCFSFFFLF
jgi:hypothetical protein